MEPINWFMKVVTQHYFDFNGRARRAEYWWYFLVVMIIFAIIMVLANLVSVAGYLVPLFWLAMLLPALGVAVRRMHDTNHSGWWLLVPIANIIFPFMAGTPGPNSYGPDPKAAV